MFETSFFPFERNIFLSLVVNSHKEIIMWRCTICGYIYDDAKEGTKFEDLPDDWSCPVCNAPKDAFVRI